MDYRKRREELRNKLSGLNLQKGVRVAILAIASLVLLVGIRQGKYNKVGCAIAAAIFAAVATYESHKWQEEKEELNAQYESVTAQYNRLKERGDRLQLRALDLLEDQQEQLVRNRLLAQETVVIQDLEIQALTKMLPILKQLQSALPEGTIDLSDPGLLQRALTEGTVSSVLEYAENKVSTAIAKSELQDLIAQELAAGNMAFGDRDESEERDDDEDEPALSPYPQPVEAVTYPNRFDDPPVAQYPSEIADDTQEDKPSHLHSTVASILKVGINPDARILDPESELVSWQVLRSLLTTEKSTMLVGTTGAGKTVFETAWLTELYKLRPEADIYAIVQKSDYAKAIPRNKVTFFDLEDPTSALEVIHKFWSIYKKRSTQIRPRVHFPPARLILADWTSIALSLKNLASSKRWKDEINASMYKAKIADLILNGRACNTPIIADVQSFNLESLGIEADANIRSNLNILGLGNRTTSADGSVNESYGVIENLFKNSWLINGQERQAAMKQYKRLKPVSIANTRPILLGLSAIATVSLMPDLKHYEGLCH